MSSLHYRHPASTWLEALPLGNGSLGAMCWGGVHRARFDLNEETVWSGSPSNEADQNQVDAATAARLLAESRRLLSEGRPEAAAEPLMRMQATYGQAYLPLGSLEIIVGDETTAVSPYRRELDLDRAIHSVDGQVAGGRVHQRTLISAAHGVLMHVIEGLPAHVVPQLRLTTALQGESGGSAPATSASPMVMRVRMPSDVAPAHEPTFASVSYSQEPGASLEGAIVVQMVTDTDALGRHRVAVYLAAATTFDRASHTISGSGADAEQLARARVAAAVTAGVDEVTAAHIVDHARLFGRVELVFENPEGPNPEPTDERLARAVQDPRGVLAVDPALAALLFDYGRYLLISCSRPGGLPATLQGIWNDSMQPPWSSSYTLNINFQMNYWAAESANLPETAEPLVDFVSALALSGRSTAARLYGARGWVAHHNSDAWLMTSPVGAGHGDPSWAFWPMSGPWLVRSLWDRVEFGSASDEFTRTTLWPVIRSTAEFLLDWTIQLPDGSWGTAPSTSPENMFLSADGTPVALTQSSAMDLALARDLFSIVEQAASRLMLADDPIVRACAARLHQLAPAPTVGTDGALREWQTDVGEVDPHHRHVSHLYPLYPGAGIADPAALAAAEISLNRRGDDSTGWSLAWKLALWARLRRPARVSDLLRLVFRQAGTGAGPWAGGLYPNLLAAHPPFQIDGNLGYVAAVTEMLVQSHRGEIELLPAVPAELGSGSVRGLVARPGIVVGMRWRDGHLVDATLRARTPEQTGPVRVRFGDRTVTVVVSAGTDTRITSLSFV